MTFFRQLGFLGLGLALVAVLGLVGLDWRDGFKLTVRHQQTGALALILIGAAYVAVHLGGRENRGARMRAIILGAAFALWGAEQFIPAGPWSTAIDSAVIGIFVVDLSWSILRRLRNPDRPGD